jgi:hypothetical protein
MLQVTSSGCALRPVKEKPTRREERRIDWSRRYGVDEGFMMSGENSNSAHGPAEQRHQAEADTRCGGLVFLSALAARQELREH